MACMITARPDPAYPMSSDAPGVAYCDTHQAYVSTGACDKARIADLEALLRRIDAVIAWETTPLGRAFQEELEAALRR